MLAILAEFVYFEFIELLGTQILIGPGRIVLLALSVFALSPIVLLIAQSVLAYFGLLLEPGFDFVLALGRHSVKLD